MVAVGVHISLPVSISKYCDSLWKVILSVSQCLLVVVNITLVLYSSPVLLGLFDVVLVQHF